MKWVAIIAGGLVALVVLVAVIGSLLPRGHVATARARLPAPPGAVWQLVSDFPGSPAWRSDVVRVEERPACDGHPVFVEVRRDGQDLPLEVLESIAPAGGRPGRLVTRIADPSLPFSGRWTWTLEAAGEGSELTLTEEGEIGNPLMRFAARLFMDEKASVEAYVAALRHKVSRSI